MTNASQDRHAADAKGYSRLMGEDELGTVQMLTRHREAIREIVQRFNGRVVDSSGEISPGLAAELDRALAQAKSLEVKA